MLGTEIHRFRTHLVDLINELKISDANSVGVAVSILVMTQLNWYMYWDKRTKLSILVVGILITI